LSVIVREARRQPETDPPPAESNPKSSFVVLGGEVDSFGHCEERSEEVDS